LDILRGRDIQLACLSNKPHEATCQAIQTLFAPGTFSAVLGQRAGVPLKPDPTSALEIATQLHTAPRQCAFLGDTAIDMETAVSSGMLPVGVLWGFRGQDELAAAGAQAILERPLGLLRVLDT
jgi:phosphoglycolate phosphatase